MIVTIFCSLFACCLLRISTLLRDWPTWESDEAAWQEHKSELSSLAALSGLFAALASAQKFEFALAGAVGGSVSVMLYVMVSHWELRQSGWFWKFWILVVCAHAIAVALIPWPVAREPNKADAFFAVADLLIVFGLLKLLERRLRQSSEQPTARPEQRP